MTDLALPVVSEGTVLASVDTVTSDSKMVLCLFQDSYSQYAYTEHPFKHNTFIVYSCRSIMMYNPTIWYHPEEDRFSFESGSSQGFYHRAHVLFLVPLSPLVCSLKIKIYIQIL